MIRPAMCARADYDLAVAVVREVIHGWDPYALIHGCGAPDDEWDGEIARIVAEIPRISTATDAAQAISRVFSSAFQPEGFGPSDCAEVGSRLFSALKDSNLLTD